MTDKTCQPPLESVTTPRLKPFEGACDCHAHIFGDPLRYPFAEGRDYTPPQCSEAAYLTMLATLGIERMVIVQPSVYGFDNSCTMDAIASFGLQRARAVVMVRPDADAAELARLDAGGARGVRFITVANGGAPLAALREVALKIAPLGWHLQLYVPPERLPELLPVLESLPVPIVLDHMAKLSPGRGADDPALSALLRLIDGGKTWVKLTAYRPSLSGWPYADMRPLGQELVRRAPERCLWGSDWPHPDLSGPMVDDGQLLDLLAQWVPERETLRKILVGNPERLYGFTAAG